MSTLRETLESLKKIQTRYVVAKDYEKAAKVRELIKRIEVHILNEER
jgi:protein-arginine kinase activator protein McsA